MQPLSIAGWSDVPDREPVGALVGNVDLVIVRYDDDHSVLYGRCDHRGALLAEDTVCGDDLGEWEREYPQPYDRSDLTTVDRELHHLAGIPYRGLDA